MAEGPRRFVHALAAGVTPEWRFLSQSEKDQSVCEMAGAVGSVAEVITFTYSTIGLRSSTDLLFWRLGPSLDALEEAAAATLRSGLGRWLRISHSFLGVVAPSPYVRRQEPDVPALFEARRRRYLVVYPFTKTSDWYALEADDRAAIMREHMKVGHQHREVRQLLANSFGVDDMDFLVAYETDDLAAFGVLVRELRETRGRMFTSRDTPLLVAVHRSIDEIAGLLGARVALADSHAA